MKIMIRPVLCVAVLVCVTYVSGQADLENSYTSDKQPLEDKALFLADALVKHPVLFRKLLKIGNSGQGLLKLGGGDPNFSMFTDFVLDMLPGVLTAQDTEAILNIMADELHRVNISQAAALIQKNRLLPNSTQAKKIMAGTMWQGFDKIRATRRILTRHSARQFLYMDENSTISDVCYNDMTNFWDTLVSMQFPPRDKLNYTFVPWAITMFDSYGKPQGGITKGALYWVGSYDQCQSVKASLPAGVIIGNRTLTAPIKFNGRFCRASFPLPSSFIKSLGVDTRGVEVSLSWGMCVPDSCHSDDIAQMFGLGAFKKFNVTPNKVVCFEENDITQDSSGLAASIIILVFVIITFFTTFVDGVSDWLKDNVGAKQEDSDKKGFELTNINGGAKVNEAYVVDPGEGTSHVVMEAKSVEGLPPAYMAHKNDKGDLGEEYLNGGGKYRSNGTPAGPVHKKQSENKKPRKSLCQQLIQAFSLYTNMPKVFNATKNPNAIHCIHGIRFFSILWIILGHTYNYGVVSEQGNPTTVNLIDADKLFKRFTFQGVQAAGFGVDTFFLLSGLLVTYLTLKDLKKRRPNCGYMGMFYFHRFWRLTPVYMIVLMTFGCLYKYLGGGPLWPGSLAAADNCKINWWTNLLYVNNLVRVDDQCMGWSWYLANDMQFYIISPIFIFLLHFLPIVGVVLTVLMMFTGIASAFAKEFIYGGDMFTMKANPHYWNQVYITPWCRVAAYTVGILLGYIMFKFKRGTLKNFPAMCGWIVCWTVGLTLCYVTYDYRAEGKEPWARWRIALFEGFSRPVWAICVGWIIFACHNGKGGVINNILSFSGIIPLSRLTYAAYLVHPIMMIVHVFSKRSLLYINDYDIAYLFMGHTVCTYMAAFFVSLIFEAPFLTLEKIFFRRGGHSS